MPSSTAESLKQAAIVVAVALVPVLVWLLFGVILMGMGAVLIAVLLNLGAEPLIRRLRISRGAALFTSGVTITCIVGAAAYYLTATQAGQLHEILQRVQQAVDSIRAGLQGSEIGRFFLSHVQGENISVSGIAAGIFGISFGFVSALVISVFGGSIWRPRPTFTATV